MNATHGANTVTDDEFLECEFLVDNHHGIYIPQSFMERHGDEWGVTGENRDILLAGPDHEWYWDAWDEVLNLPYEKDGLTWYLHLGECGDVFAVVYRDAE